MRIEAQTKLAVWTGLRHIAYSMRRCCQFSQPVVRLGIKTGSQIRCHAGTTVEKMKLAQR